MTILSDEDAMMAVVLPLLHERRKTSANKRAGVHGVPVPMRNYLVSKANGICESCGHAEAESVPLSKLELDHDHKTLELRGILCAGCNRALGNLRDDPERIAGLLAYINKYTH